MEYRERRKMMNVRNMRECEEVVGSYRKPQEIATEPQAPKALNPEGVEYLERRNVMKRREMRK